uniref:Uncharacterized protein n=1 Tax=Brassica oleracea TaxID=3712 RepID=A0A3P6E867_BRAOL|nr:unnamed protein product [Brassica oleracea]
MAQNSKSYYSGPQGLMRRPSCSTAPTMSIEVFDHEVVPAIHGRGLQVWDVAPPLIGGYGNGYGGWGWSPFSFFAPGPAVAIGVGGGFDPSFSSCFLEPLQPSQETFSDQEMKKATKITIRDEKEQKF